MKTETATLLDSGVVNEATVVSFFWTYAKHMKN